ncbi:MAG: dihydrolipoyl dehydrogenase [Acidimicrobiales bacterium]|nr:dihydrolipoyl dehydrogenase [Acidimicrobiales bacterium]
MSQTSESSETHYDVAVIGGGPGGYAAALSGASAGLNVALVEMDKVGGTCLHRGCIPAKELLETASRYRSIKESSDFGVSVSEPVLDFSVTQARKAKVVDQLFKGLSGVLKNRKVTVIAGRGRLVGKSSVEIALSEGGTSLISAESIILASGSSPRTIPGFELDNKFIMTSDEVLAMEALPPKVAVIGGGAIGCEFASMLSDLACEVTILEVAPRLIPGCDGDVATALERSFKKRGISVKTGVSVSHHSPKGDETTVHYGENQELLVNAIVVSVGRKPLSEDLVDEGVGVEIDERGFVKVDQLMRTSVPGIWAIGDLVNTPQLAHVGFAEARVAISDILGEKAAGVDYGKVPWCIYTHPEVAFVGLTEDGAKEKGIEVIVKKDPFGGNSRARIIGETEGLVKVVALKNPDGTAGKILGVHMIGPWVTEMLGSGYFAINWEATVDEVASLIQPHPTLSESFGETVIALTGRGLHVE